MELIRGDSGQGQKAAYPVVAIGNFDGVHRGHQAILQRTVERAKAKGGTGIALTFTPHPLSVLAPHLELKFLMSFEDRLQWIEEMGIDRARIVSFTPEFSHLTPPEFVRKIIRDDLGAREVVVGTRFTFGRDRRGTVADLEAMSASFGFLVHALEPVLIDGTPVSSSRIRDCLLSGRVREARELLGRPYALEGPIVQGMRRGKALGYPTANFRPPKDRVIPSNGVYAVRAEIEGRKIEGVTYIGTQPTLGPAERMVETHLFEPQPDRYDRVIRVQFLDWLRPEEVFTGRTELIERIEEDIQKARTVLSERPPA